jgi:hypothetical protein
MPPEPAPAKSAPRTGLDSFPSIALVAAEGDILAPELAATLARVKSWRVVAVAGKPTAGRAGTDYVLTLSWPRKVDGVAGPMVQLADGPSGIMLWAERFEAKPDWSVAEQIASALESEVQAAEMTRGSRGNAESAEAYDLYLRARRLLQTSREADNRVAFSLLMAALDLEPENVAYLAAATEATHHRISVGWEAIGTDDKQLVRELAYRTLQVADGNAVAIALAGVGLFTGDEEDMALALCRRALAMNQTSQLVLACALHAERWGGSMEESERIAARAVMVAPNDPAQRFALGGLAAIASWRGDYDGALEFGRKSLAYGPGLTLAHHSVIDALVGFGRQEAAEQQLARYLSVSRGVTIRSFERGQHHADQSRVSHRLKNLRRLGMPER